jgi:hypothetical protein
MPKAIPEICDYDCPHADFPPADTAGICRTMSAVWCGQLTELVYKNTPCEYRRRQEDAPKKRRTATRKTTSPKKTAKRKKTTQRKRAAARKKTTRPKRS